MALRIEISCENFRVAILALMDVEFRKESESFEEYVNYGAMIQHITQISI
jgi:hypothetical protein